VCPQQLRQHRALQRDALIAKVLEHLAAVILRIGIGAPQAENMLRAAFVYAAESYARSQNLRVNQSQIAMLAGINRIDVRNVMRARPKKQRVSKTQSNRLDVILAAWRDDPQYCDRRGRPKPLSYRGSRSELGQLVRKYGRDVTSKSIVEQLVRVGAVAKKAENLVLLSHVATQSIEVSAALADLKFLEMHLKGFRLRMGRRAYLTRSASVSVGDGRVARRLQRTTLEKIQLMLKSLEAVSGDGPDHRSGHSHRVIVTATVATESGRGGK
jgi:hypothetical protein